MTGTFSVRISVHIAMSALSGHVHSKEDSSLQNHSGWFHTHKWPESKSTICCSFLPKRVTSTCSRWRMGMWTFLLSLWQVGEYFLAYPHDVLAIFDEVLHQTGTEASQKALTEHNGAIGAKRNRMRQTLHSRITGLIFYLFFFPGKNNWFVGLFPLLLYYV